MLFCRQIHQWSGWVVACLLLFSACLPKQEVLRNPGAESGKGPVINRPTGPISQSGLDYIERHKHIAIEEMNRHGIPASIKLAQGILESGNGNSRLAREANNHFGIKCAGDWRGKRTYHDDDERNECFRVYASVEESYRDHSQFLLRKRYEQLFRLKATDYRGWAKGLREAGYATNPRYADLLINLIERYELYRYDQPRTAWTRDSQPSPEIGQKPVAPPTEVEKRPEKKSPSTMRIHEVGPGETLASIAARYGLDPAKLQEINELKTQEVHRGQLLIVSY